ARLGGVGVREGRLVACHRSASGPRGNGPFDCVTRLLGPTRGKGPPYHRRMADLTLGAIVDAASHQRTDAPVVVPTGDLTTHGVIVGMTGSGKTGLGIVLIEECLSAGLPCLLIDPKGDLANLRLVFPDLAPS